MRTLIRGVRIVDEATDMVGSVLIEGGRIAAVMPWLAGSAGLAGTELEGVDRIIDGRCTASPSPFHPPGV